MASEEPEPNIGVLMFVAHRAMEAAVLEAVRAAGYTDITVAQARVFQRIEPGGSRLTDLAAAAQVTKQTAGFLVDQLESSGYVERVPDPDDARARLVRIAARGRAAAKVAARTVERVEADWAEHLGPRAWTALRSSLVRLREITDPYR